MPFISKNKFFSNSIFGVFGQFVTFASQIISVPFFMHHWGQEIYGQWIFLMTIPPYFSLLDLGMGTVISNELTQAATNHAFDTYRMLLRKFMTWQCKVVFWAILVYFTAIFLLTKLEILQTGMSGSSGTWALLGLYGLCTLGETLAFYFFRSLNQSDTIQLIWNMLRLLELILTIFVLTQNGNATMLLFVLVTFKLVGLIIIFARFFVKNPETLFGPPAIIEFSMDTNLKKGIKYSFFPASNLLLNGGTIWIINYFLGAGSTVIFSTMRTLVNSLRQIAEIIKQSIWPKISSGFYDNNMDRMHKTYVTGYWLTLGMTILLGGILWFGESYIFQLWLGPTWHTDNSLLLYLLVSTIFLVQWQISSVVLESTNMFDKFAKAQIFAHITFLLFTFSSVKFWGLNGVAILLVLLHLSLCVYIIHELRKIFSVSSTSELLSFNKFSWKILFSE
jgi:O-antigen/teichoic acid export membrane protein